MCDLITALTIGSTVMGGMGAIQQGKAQAAAAEYQAKVSNMNAALAERQSREIVEKGQVEEQQQRMKAAKLIGEQKATMAANGVDLSFGSPLDTLVDSAKMAELDALTIRSNTYKAERDARQQANNYRAQASIDLATGANAQTAGYMSALGTVIGNAGTAYKNYKTTGVASL